MTKLLYLDETYLFEANAFVQAVDRDERGGFLTLDQTVFYPQGGGQPADKGYIQIEGENIPVSFVSFYEGVVRHNVPDAYWKETYIGKMAKLSVDRLYRLDNARLHTGGHLISHVLETLDARLIPIKGYHFPEGGHVEFVNEHGVDANALIEEANEKLAQDVAVSFDVTAELANFDTISRLRPHLAPFVPKDKPSRIVTIGGYVGLPCGGTHVANLMQLGSIKVTKAKKQKANLRVSYELGDPPGIA